MISKARTRNRRRMNLTIREEVVNEAKLLNLNVSQAAEAGIVQAIREARAQHWQEENKSAIDSHNRRVEDEGVLLTPDWTAD